MNTGEYSSQRPSLLAVLSVAWNRLCGKQPDTSHTPNALLTALEVWWKPEGGSDEPPANTAIVKLLLNHGANVNCGDRDGDTPLIMATLSGRFDIVRMLIDRGTNLNVKDSYGFTAYDYAGGSYQHLPHEQILKLLKRFGAKLGADE